MHQTAKRRWSRELPGTVDGIGLAEQGPILVHVYEEPPGGKWIDEVIPGRLHALDRSSGAEIWRAPCEVGYGRGFAVGFGAKGQVLVLGPSMHGHRIVRMAIDSGELLDAGEIPIFDVAQFAGKRIVCCAAGRVFAIDSLSLEEVWEYARPGERYHDVTVLGTRVIVSWSHPRGGHGVLALDLASGAFEGVLLPPNLSVIHGLVATEGVAILLTEDLGTVLEGPAAADLMRQIALHPSKGVRDTLSMVALTAGGEPTRMPAWIHVLETGAHDGFPEASISADSGKLYLERGNHLNALDALSGRPLGVWAVPGLDERVDWRVASGAGLLAEEQRISIFELLA